MERNVIIVVVVIVALAFGALVWWKQSQSTEPASTPLPAQQSSPAAPAQPQIPEPAPEVEIPGITETPLPELDESDDVVRREVLAASGTQTNGSDSTPATSTLATRLGQDDLVRRFAVLANNAAKGQYPWRQLGFLAPAERMPVIVDDDGRIEMDPKGYARFDRFVDTVTSVQPSAAAALSAAPRPAGSARSAKADRLAESASTASGKPGANASSPRPALMFAMAERIASGETSRPSEMSSAGIVRHATALKLAESAAMAPEADRSATPMALALAARLALAPRLANSAAEGAPAPSHSLMTAGLPNASNTRSAGAAIVFVTQIA